MGDYDGYTLDELREEAKERDLPVSGNKPELVDRLEADDAAAATEEKADANPMVADDGTLDAEALFTYTSDVRALVDDIRARLDAEADRPLAEAAGLVAEDPRAAALTGASRRIRAHLDDVHRALGGLVAAVTGLPRDITGP